MNDRSDASHIVVFTTLGSIEAARTLVQKLVNDNLVACGTVVPSVSSIYRWEGDVTESSEVLVILKTQREKWSKLSTTVAEHHPYEVPELLALAVEAGLPAYLNWVTEETAPADKEPR